MRTFPPPLSFFVQVRSAQQHIGGRIQEFGDTGNGLINEMLPRPFLPSVTMEIWSEEDGWREADLTFVTKKEKGNNISWGNWKVASTACLAFGKRRRSCFIIIFSSSLSPARPSPHKCLIIIGRRYKRGTAAAGWGIRRRSISQKMKHVFKVGISLGNLCRLIVKMLKIDIFCPYSFVSFSFVVSSFLLLPFSLLRSVCLLDLSSWILDSDADFGLPLSDFERKRRKGRRGFGLQLGFARRLRRGGGGRKGDFRHFPVISQVFCRWS